MYWEMKGSQRSPNGCSLRWWMHTHTHTHTLATHTCRIVDAGSWFPIPRSGVTVIYDWEKIQGKNSQLQDVKTKRGWEGEKVRKRKGWTQRQGERERERGENNGDRPRNSGCTHYENYWKFEINFSAKQVCSRQYEDIKSKCLQDIDTDRHEEKEIMKEKKQCWK